MSSRVGTYTVYETMHKKYHIYQVLTVELPLFRGEVLTAHLEPRHPAWCLLFFSKEGSKWLSVSIYRFQFKFIVFWLFLFFRFFLTFLISLVFVSLIFVCSFTDFFWFFFWTFCCRYLFPAGKKNSVLTRIILKKTAGFGNLLIFRFLKLFGNRSKEWTCNCFCFIFLLLEQ